MNLKLSTYKYYKTLNIDRLKLFCTIAKEIITFTKTHQYHNHQKIKKFLLPFNCETLMAFRLLRKYINMSENRSNATANSPCKSDFNSSNWWLNNKIEMFILPFTQLFCHLQRDWSSFYGFTFRVAVIPYGFGLASIPCLSRPWLNELLTAMIVICCGRSSQGSSRGNKWNCF